MDFCSIFSPMKNTDCLHQNQNKYENENGLVIADEQKKIK